MVCDRQKHRQTGRGMVKWFNQLSCSPSYPGGLNCKTPSEVPLFTLVETIGIPSHCPSVHLSVRCNLEPEITKKTIQTCFMKLGMWLSGNMLIMNVIFSPLQEHCVYYGNRNSQIVAKTNLSQIKASLMKLGMWTGAGYARHFWRRIKLIVVWLLW